MSSPLSLTASLSDMPFDAQLIVVLALVIVTALWVMGRSGLDDRGRMLIGRYMLVGLAVLILVALVMGALRRYDTENSPPPASTAASSAPYVPGLVFDRYCLKDQTPDASIWSPPCSLTLFP